MVGSAAPEEQPQIGAITIEMVAQGGLKEGNTELKGSRFTEARTAVAKKSF
jgi:hypothetical protein